MAWEQVLLVPSRNSFGCSDLFLLLAVEFLTFGLFVVHDHARGDDLENIF